MRARSGVEVGRQELGEGVDRGLRPGDVRVGGEGDLLAAPHPEAAVGSPDVASARAAVRDVLG